MEKGLKKLSTFNVWLAIGVMVFILFAGPTVSLIKSEINSLGLYASEFIRLNTRMTPYENESFVERWTIFLLGLVDCFYAYDGNVCSQNFQRQNH